MQRKAELIAWHTAAKRLVIRGWSDDDNAQLGGIMTRGHVFSSGCGTRAYTRAVRGLDWSRPLFVMEDSTLMVVDDISTA